MLAGLTGDTYTLTIENLRPVIAAQLVAEPLSTVSDLTAWFLANIGAGEATMSEDYEETVHDLITVVMPDFPHFPESKRFPKKT